MWCKKRNETKRQQENLVRTAGIPAPVHTRFGLYLYKLDHLSWSDNAKNVFGILVSLTLDLQYAFLATDPCVASKNCTRLLVVTGCRSLLVVCWFLKWGQEDYSSIQFITETRQAREDIRQLCSVVITCYNCSANTIQRQSVVCTLLQTLHYAALGSIHIIQIHITLVDSAFCLPWYSRTSISFYTSWY